LFDSGLLNDKIQIGNLAIFSTQEEGALALEVCTVALAHCDVVVAFGLRVASGVDYLLGRFICKDSRGLCDQNELINVCDCID